VQVYTQALRWRLLSCSPLLQIVLVLVKPVDPPLAGFGQISLPLWHNVGRTLTVERLRQILGRMSRSACSAVYAAPGYLLFVDGDTLLAQASDADRLQTSGQPFLLVVGRIGNMLEIKAGEKPRKEPGAVIRRAPG
jgi:hypothetical protein